VRYGAAIAYLYSLAPRGMRLELDRVTEALAQRGHPERVVPAIVVGGTNGKGSVATMLATVLGSAGYKVGLFTSPHLHRLVERFRVGGKSVSQAELARRITAFRPYLEANETPALTFFEVATLIALELFRDARCDVSVLEVGLGGRLDATNAVRPLVSVITSVALDHTDRLGTTLPAIAREKAGILKQGVPAVSGVRAREARSVIAARARRVGAALAVIDRDFGAIQRGSRFEVWTATRRASDLAMPLGGGYQADNLACAVAALDAVATRFPVDERSLRRGLARVRWPGRLELLPGAPAVLCDAAHNPHACAALARHLREACGHYRRKVLLFGVMRDKDHGAMLALLAPELDAMVFTSVDTGRAVPAEELATEYGGEAREWPVDALALARKRAGKRGLVVACGSIYVMSQVRAAVLGLRADPPITL
jgi:dihydrofolate synthase / folylpolyglutamate synthase